MGDYRDDVPHEENLRYSTPPFGQVTGWAGGANGETEGLPIGLHFSPAQRREQRLNRAGIVVVRLHPNRKR